MKQRLRIGVDIGGTNMRAALVSPQGIVRKAAVPTPAHESGETVINALEGIVGSLLTPEVESIGVGVPSVMDREAGIVYDVVNIPAWHEVPLKSILEREFQLPVYLNNDSNCFTLGEARYGDGRQFSDFVGVTLGTGLGAGIIIGGQLYSGHNTGAGEIGALPYRDSDIEHYCSSSFFNRLGTTAADLCRLVRQGDAEAAERWRQFGLHMGRMVIDVIYAYDPEAVIIGGGIARSFDLFAPSMRATIATCPYSRSASRLKVLPSRLEDAALLGAASLTG